MVNKDNNPNNIHIDNLVSTPLTPVELSPTMGYSARGRSAPVAEVKTPHVENTQPVYTGKNRAEHKNKYPEHNYVSNSCARGSAGHYIL